MPSAQITKYILKSLAASTLLITLALTVSVWLTRSLHLVDMIINRGIPLSTFLYFALLLLPNFLIYILPIAFLIAVLFTYNRLQNDSELIVMRAIGLSPLRLASPAIIMGIIIAGILYLFTLQLAPASYRDFKTLEYEIRNNYSTLLLEEGVFTNFGNNVTVFVESRGKNGEVGGLLVHESHPENNPSSTERREPQKNKSATQSGGTELTWIAEKGRIIGTDSGPKVIMENGTIQKYDPQKGTLATLFFDQNTLNLSLLSQDIAARWQDPRERTLHQLRHPTSWADITDHYGEFIAEYHRRLTTPLLAPILGLMALAFFLPNNFSRRQSARRLLIPSVTALLLITLHLSLLNLASKNLNLIPLIYLNLFFAVSLSIARLEKATFPERYRRLDYFLTKRKWHDRHAERKAL